MKAVIALIILTGLVSAKGQFFSVVEKDKAELVKKVFNHYDSDKNGALSFKEYLAFYNDAKEKHLQKRAARAIKSCDKNGNGKIDLNETISLEERYELFKKHKMLTQICLMPKEQFKIVDKDKNRAVTKEELINFYKNPIIPFKDIQKEQKARALKMFKEHLKRDCDKNSDGNITLKEAVLEKCGLYSDIFIKYSGGADKSFKISDIKKLPDESQNPKEEASRFLRECDDNGDLKLNLIEAASSRCMLSYEKFTKLDKDKNSFLNKSELIALFKEESKKKIPNMEFAKDMPDEAKISLAYRACDESQDGILSKEEAKKCKLSMDVFNKFDYNKNGKIEQSDLNFIRIRRGFKYTDSNSNGKIELKEFLNRANQSCSAY